MTAPDRSTPAGAHAADRLRDDEMIWLTTVRADGQPQTSAVWFHWDGTDFLLFSQPGAAKLRNLAAAPRVSLHLDGDGLGGDLVIVEGEAVAVPGDAAVPKDAAGTWPEPDRVGAYYAKYERTLRERLGSTAGEMRAAFSTALRVTPTRWRVVP